MSELSELIEQCEVDEGVEIFVDDIKLCDSLVEKLKEKIVNRLIIERKIDIGTQNHYKAVVDIAYLSLKEDK